MCVYVCVYVCMYMCVYAYMYVYVCIIYWGNCPRWEMSYPKREGNCLGGIVQGELSYKSIFFSFRSSLTLSIQIFLCLLCFSFPLHVHVKHHRLLHSDSSWLSSLSANRLELSVLLDVCWWPLTRTTSETWRDLDKLSIIIISGKQPQKRPQPLDSYCQVSAQCQSKWCWSFKRSLRLPLSLSPWNPTHTWCGCMCVGFCQLVFSL